MRHELASALPFVLDSEGCPYISFELRTAFPNMAYPDDKTLRAAGLVPNATMFIRLLESNVGYSSEV